MAFKVLMHTSAVDTTSIFIPAVIKKAGEATLTKQTLYVYLHGMHFECCGVFLRSDMVITPV